MIHLPIDPIAKPRMTQRDRWKKRPVVLRYRAFCDEVRLRLQDYSFPPAGAHVTFFIPMPKSWSKKKKREHYMKPHQQKPDVDNLEKALLDALFEDDSHIYDIRASKYWANEGLITIQETSLERLAA